MGSGPQLTQRPNPQGPMAWPLVALVRHQTHLTPTGLRNCGHPLNTHGRPNRSLQPRRHPFGTSHLELTHSHLF